MRPTPLPPQLAENTIENSPIMSLDVTFNIFFFGRGVRVRTAATRLFIVPPYRVRSGAIVQSVGAGTNSGTTTGVTVTLATFGSPNNAAYGYSRNNGLNTQTPTAGLVSLSDDTQGENAAWGINRPSVGWTWASQTNVNVTLAIEVRASAPVKITHNPTYDGLE